MEGLGAGNSAAGSAFAGELEEASSKRWNGGVFVDFIVFIVPDASAPRKPDATQVRCSPAERDEQPAWTERIDRTHERNYPSTQWRFDELRLFEAYGAMLLAVLCLCRTP